jgi:hypothetical protein
VKVNINRTAGVTLTEAGLRRLRDYHADLGRDPPPAQDTTDRPVVFLIWEAMHIFGPMLDHGAIEIPFVDNVIEVYPAPDDQQGS